MQLNKCNTLDWENRAARFSAQRKTNFSSRAGRVNVICRGRNLIVKIEGVTSSRDIGAQLEWAQQCFFVKVEAFSQSFKIVLNKLCLKWLRTSCLSKFHELVCSCAVFAEGTFDKARLNLEKRVHDKLQFHILSKKPKFHYLLTATSNKMRPEFWLWFQEAPVRLRATL